MAYLTLTPETLPAQHICCAFADRKCDAGTALKKDWLAREYREGWRFHRLDERAKVFVEYGPADTAWLPVEAPGCMMIGCFWVSGRFAGQGHGTTLLEHVTTEARAQGLSALVTVAGKTKMPSLSDGKWLKAQGFTLRDSTATGFELLARDLGPSVPPMGFSAAAWAGLCPDGPGVSVYYSNRCPFTELHVTTTLAETCRARGLPLRIHRLTSRDEARAAPTPATIFSLFLDGRFVTTDLSVCLPDRFDRMRALS